MIFRITILTGIQLVITTLLCTATPPDEPVNQAGTLAAKQIMLLNTVWSDSENAAALTYLDFSRKIASAMVYSEIQNNRFHRFQAGDKFFQSGFFTDGYVNHNKWKFYGSFNYFSQTEKNIKWSGVMNPYNDNPYTVGDSIGGNFTREFFNMEGKGAYRLNNKFTFGFDINYTTGVGAKRKDPRPETTITTFDFIPGIIYESNKIKAGINLRYIGSREEIDYSSVTSKTNYLFHFKGLGVFTSTSEFDKRLHISDEFGTGLQFNYAGNKINNLTEINFSRKQTDIKRGVSYPLQIVLLEQYYTKITSSFMFNSTEPYIKKLILNYSVRKLYGHEPIVEPKPEAVSYQWSTVQKYTLYWHNENELGIRYLLYKLKDKQHFNWGIQFSGNVNLGETTYYFVPEFNRQKLNMLNFESKAEKSFQAEKSELIIGFDAGYRKSFNSKLNIVEDENLRSTVNTTFVIHDFNYHNCGLLLLDISAKAGTKVKVRQNQAQLFAEVGAKTFISDLPGQQKSNIMEVKLGFNF